MNNLDRHGEPLNIVTQKDFSPLVSQHTPKYVRMLIAHSLNSIDQTRAQRYTNVAI